MIPARPKINIYQSSKNALLFLFKDSDGADYDLSIYSSIKGVVLRGFDRKNPVLEFEPTITGNQLSYTLSPEVTEATFPRSGYVIEFRFFSSEWIPLVVADVVLNNAFKAGTVLNQSELIVTEEQVIVNVSETAELAGIALGAAEEAVQAKEDTEAAAAQALIDIEDARVAALGQIDTAEGDAVTAVNNARDAGVLAVEGARDQGVGAVETARDNAITAINLLVTQAEEARDESVAAKDISVAAKDDAVDAKVDAESARDDAQLAQTGSETARDESVAAKDEIVDKIDFTGLVQGDILRRDGTKLVRINEKEFLKNPVPLYGSFLSAHTVNDSHIAWDSFVRPNGAIGKADSGQDWVTILGTGYNITDSRALPAVNEATMTGLSNPTKEELVVGGLVRTSTGGDPRRNGFFMARDANNWFRFGVSNLGIIVEKNVSGTITQLTSFSLRPSFPSPIPKGNNTLINQVFHWKLRFLSWTDDAYFLLTCDEIGVRLGFDLSEHVGVFRNEINYAGLFGLHTGGGGIRSFYMHPAR
jgi:hypothetical protein